MQNRKLFIAALVLSLLIAFIGVLAIVQGVEEHNNRRRIDEHSRPSVQTVT